MENQINSKSIILNYGFYLGVIGILVNLTLFATGSLLDFEWVGNLAGTIAMIAIVVLGIKKIKEVNNGLLSWGEGVKIGLGISMVNAVIAVVYTYIFMNYIDPTYLERAMELQNQKWINQGLTESDIEKAKEIAQKFQSTASISVIILVTSAFFGFIISAIASAIMKKTEDTEA